MTIIAALKTPDCVFMGCDSQSTRGWTKSKSDPKIFKSCGFLIGCAGAVRISNLANCCDFPKPQNDDPFKFMVTEFVPIWQKFLEFSSASKKEHEKQSASGGLLVAWSANLFCVAHDFAVIGEPEYQATGSGADIAIGSLYSTKGDDPKQRIKTALKAAIEHDMGCGGSTLIKKT